MNLSEPVRQAAHVLIDGVSVIADDTINPDQGLTAFTLAHRNLSDPDAIVGAATLSIGWLVHQLAVAATVSEEIVLFQLRAFIDSHGSPPL
jgi:hypothetical protein